VTSTARIATISVSAAPRQASNLEAGNQGGVLCPSFLGFGSATINSLLVAFAMGSHHCGAPKVGAGGDGPATVVALGPSGFTD